MKKALSLLLAMVIALMPMLSLAEETDEEAPEEIARGLNADAGKYVYKDAVTALPDSWNPHTGADGYPGSLLRGGLYAFLFNDALHPIEGREPFSGCVIVPEMAVGEPVDVTERVKAEHPEFGIPQSAEAGFAYTIDLNPDCVWEDGTPIDASTYVYSMRRLLDPRLQNSRAADYYTGDFIIAGAEAYANGGRTVKTDNGVSRAYALEDLVQDENGLYATEEGFPVYLALDYPLDCTMGYTLKDYVDTYGEAYFSMTNWEALTDRMDDNGLAPLTGEAFALFADVITGNPAWGESEAEAPNYFIIEKTYPEADFDAVGLYKSGEYQITLALAKPLTGFKLLKALTGCWIVKEDLYEAGPAAYCTGVETTASCGPYRLAGYEAGKSMRFTRNEAWYGYQDGRHVYTDPEDGETYPLYMSGEVVIQAADAALRKEMFFQGQLMEYPLQSEDYAAYRSSEAARFIPGTTVFFLVLNGNQAAVAEREAAPGFDAQKNDLQTLTVPSFRRAITLSLDREAFAAAVSPARIGCLGLIGDAYLYDPDTGFRYRDTDAARQALPASSPDAVPELYKTAFDEALAAGYITDSNGDGVCDQTIQIEYAASAASTFLDRVVDCLNGQIAQAVQGTPFEGRVSFSLSAPRGEAWSGSVKAGLSDTVFSGWIGAASDPFSLIDLYINPAYAYNVQWFDAAGTELTVTVEGEEITASLQDWSSALNGGSFTADGREYRFGADQASPETRLTILAALEAALLDACDYIPMLQEASAVLLSQQIRRVTDTYNPVLGFGGLLYGRYNYDEAQWKEYVEAQPGGTLAY